MSNSRTAAGEIMKILGARDQRKNIAQVTKRERGGTTNWTDLSNHHTSHQTGGSDVISVDDNMVGDRTLTDVDAPTSSTGKLTILLGWLANMIKSITGQSSWRTAPSATLEQLATHLGDHKLHRHYRVRASTTANITLSGTQTVDDIALIEGDRVLVKDQTDGSENGVYVVASGAWSRVTDFDAQEDFVSGEEFYVMDGTTNKKRVYNLTNIEPITLGTTALVFEQVTGGSGGSGVPINWLGAWSGVTTYAKNDGVDINGSSYVSLQDNNTNNQPPNGTWWQLVAEKGDQGIQGVQGEQGVQGIQGVKGDQGDPGTIGDYAHDIPNTSGLTFAYLGGKVRTDNVVYITPSGSVVLTDNATNYVEADTGSGTVSSNTSGFTSGRTPLYTVATSGGSITTVTDSRCFFRAGGTSTVSWFTMNTAWGTAISVTTDLLFTSVPVPT